MPRPAHSTPTITVSISPPSTPETGLFSRQLLLFTGKGGVGKSTVVAALGVAAAERGLRPLIVELGHRASMGSIFPGSSIDHRPHPVACGGRLAAMNLELDEALFDYVVGQVKIRRIARAIAGNASLRGLFRAAPAVREIITLAKLQALADDLLEDGRRRWQPILVDLDATGHALMLLELPQLLRSLVESGPLVRVTESLSGLIADRERTILSLVSLAREVPVQETIELYADLQERHAIEVGSLFVNQVPPPALPSTLLPWLSVAEDRLREKGQGKGRLAADLRLTRRLDDEHRSARAQIERLKAELPGIPRVELPVIRGGIHGEADLLRLGELALAVESGADRGAEPASSAMASDGGVR